MEKIRGLAKERHNKKCFVCQRMGPHSNVVVSPLHVFVCTQCSGIHRNFSHRVKGISAASFSEDEVAALEANGNKRERRKWLATYKESDCPIDDESSPAQIQRFMHRMFEKKEWYSAKPSRRLEHLKKSPASNSHRSSRRQRDRRDTEASDDDELSDSAMSTSSRRSRQRRRRGRSHRDTDTPRSQASGHQRRSSMSSETPHSTASLKNGTPKPKEEKQPPAKQESGLVDLLDDLILTPDFNKQQSKSAELDDTMLGQERKPKASSDGTNDDFDDAAFADDGDAFGETGTNGTSSDAKKLDDAFSHLVPAQQNNSLHTNGPTSANFEQGITHLLSVLSQVQMQYQFSDIELKNACRSALERIQKQNAAVLQSRVMAAQTGAFAPPPGMYPYPAGGPGAHMMPPGHPAANGVGGGTGSDPFGDGVDNPFDDAPTNGAHNSQMPAAVGSPWGTAQAQYAPHTGGYGGSAPGFGNVVSQAMQQAAPVDEDYDDANNPFA